MATETLSQSEIDRLLGGSGGGGTAAPSERYVEQDFQIYDFRRPHRVSKERMRTLEAMYGRLAKSLEGWLMGRVRGQVEISLQGVDQLSFGEFTLSLSTPCCSYLFDIADSGGQQGVIDLGSEFAFFLVDRLFGGSGPPAVQDRVLTPIERMAVRTVADRVAVLVCEIWRDHTDLGMSLAGWESIPEILQASNREDPVLVGNLQVSAAGVRGLVMICLPFSVLEKFFTGGGPRRENTVIGSEREREANRELTETSLKATRVQIATRLPEFRVSMRDLAAMRVGTVLSTGIACNSQVEVLINGQPRFRAAPGRIGRGLAARVAEPIHRPDVPTLPGVRPSEPQPEP